MSYKRVSSSGILHLTQPLTSQPGRISYQSAAQGVIPDGETNTPLPSNPARDKQRLLLEPHVVVGLPAMTRCRSQSGLQGLFW
ncbi:hypothetical protein KQQSB11_380155 [Klebsiella quasipneumoniae subsp. quasipneumoniae]|nr:hypothetical protein KQQSB11_380155 [Klebsiella quasipneumoniae subsp. quasipneumoniae]